MDSCNQVKILVADSNTNTRKLLAEHLRGDDFLVEEAKDGLDALKMIEMYDYHLMNAG